MCKIIVLMAWMFIYASIPKHALLQLFLAMVEFVVKGSSPIWYCPQGTLFATMQEFVEAHQKVVLPTSQLAPPGGISV